MKLNLIIEDERQAFKLSTIDGDIIDGIESIELKTTESGHHQAVVTFFVDSGSLRLSGTPGLFPAASKV